MNGRDVYKEKYNHRIDMVTHDDIMEGFKNFLINTSTSSTVYQYITYVNKFLVYTNKEIIQIKPMDYTNYLASISSKSSSYKISVYAALKRFSEFLYINQISDKHYMADIRRPKAIESQETKEKREKGFLTKKEIKRYTYNINKGVGSARSKARQADWVERDKAIIYLFLQTGMRCSALYKLDVEDVDFDNKQLIITDKGNKVMKKVLSDNMLNILKEWIDKRETLECKDNALFVSNRKERISNQGISDIVKKYAYNIEGKHITPHKLRGTFGTQLYNAKHDIVMVQNAMGHSSPTVTRKYIRGQEDNGKEAAEVMSSLIF